MPNLIRLAIIDDASRYTQHLGFAISSLLETSKKGNAALYLPKSKLFGKMSVLKLNFSNSKELWSSFFYPFQICRRAKADKVNLAHLQLEINTFGHPITLALLPLLLTGLWLFNIRIAVTVHGVFPRFLLNSPNTNLSLGRSRFSRLFLSIFSVFLYNLLNIFSSCLIVHSKIFKAWLTDYDVDSRKIHVIPHGVATGSHEFNPLRMEHWLKKTSRKRVILCFGVISPRKGLENLIRAYQATNKSHPDSILVLAGYEPAYFNGYKKKLQLLVKELSIDDKVIFTGPLAERDVGYLFNIAEIIVLPYSYSISASGPLTIALEYAKPIVASDTVFFKNELVNGKNSILVEPGNPLTLSFALNTLLENKVLREQLSYGAKSAALKTSWKQIAQKTVNLYETIVNINLESSQSGNSIHKNIHLSAALSACIISEFSHNKSKNPVLICISLFLGFTLNRKRVKRLIKHLPMQFLKTSRLHLKLNGI